MALPRPSDPDDASNVGEDLDPFRPPQAEDPPIPVAPEPDGEADVEPPRMGFFALLAATARAAADYPRLCASSAVILAAEGWFFSVGYGALQPAVEPHRRGLMVDMVLWGFYREAFDGPFPERLWARAEGVVQTGLVLFLLETWLFCGLTKAWLDACSGRGESLAKIASGGRWTLVSLGVNALFALAWLTMEWAAGPGLDYVNVSTKALLLLGWAVGSTFLWTASSTATSAIVAEDRGVFEAFRRSYELVRPHFYAMAAVLLLYGFLQTAIPAAAAFATLYTYWESPTYIGTLLSGGGRAFLVMIYVQAFLLAGGSPPPDIEEEPDSDEPPAEEF